MSVQANITEIFPSFQGEGIDVGLPQIFVRFGGCHLRCAYCDEPWSLVKQPVCHLYTSVGSSTFESHPNPITLERLGNLLDTLSSSHPNHRSIAITGGEPLLQSNFLKEWLPDLRKRRFQTYLETSGTHPDRLKPLLPFLDTIAMDMKLPSVGGGAPYWREHEAFLKAAQGIAIFVKGVCSRETARHEIETACQIVRKVDPEIPFVLQPVTPYGTITDPPTSDQLEEWRELCQNYLSHVSIQAQTHKALGIK